MSLKPSFSITYHYKLVCWHLVSSNTHPKLKLAQINMKIRIESKISTEIDICMRIYVIETTIIKNLEKEMRDVSS